MNDIDTKFKNKDYVVCESLDFITAISIGFKTKLARAFKAGNVYEIKVENGISFVIGKDKCLWGLGWGTWSLARKEWD